VACHIAGPKSPGLRLGTLVYSYRPYDMEDLKEKLHLHAAMATIGADILRQVRGSIPRCVVTPRRMQCRY
jgi:hypothetical protein